MEHSKTFGFSSAHRWVPCNGFLKLMQDEPPKEDTQESKEGTAAHYVADAMLNSFKWGGDHLIIGNALIGRTAPNGIIITDEMMDSALTYVDAVMKVVGDDPERRKMLLIENRVDSKYIDPEAWGTADAILYDIPTNTLYIWDFKHGHRSVDAIGNLQLVGYGQAAVETFNYEKINPRLSLNIIQPRCWDGQGAVRNWTIAFDHLRAYINDMRHAVSGYRMNMTELVTGKWCRDCPVSYRCPALTQATATGIEHSQKTMSLEMSPEAIAYEKRILDVALERMKERKTAIDTQIENRVRKGEFIPGYNMQDKMSHSTWNDPNNISQIQMIGELCKANFIQKPKPITPTQAKAELKKLGVDESVISAYHSKHKTGVQLVADDGSRAKHIFSQEQI